MMKTVTHFEKEKKYRHHFRVRANYTDGHHMVPRSRGGEQLDSNTLKLDAYKHHAMHLLFGNRTMNKIIKFLAKFDNMQEFLDSTDKVFKNEACQLLFGTKTKNEVINLLKRAKRIKESYKIRMRVTFESSNMAGLLKAA
jgi:hypothetical protein